MPGITRRLNIKVQDLIPAEDVTLDQVGANKPRTAGHHHSCFLARRNQAICLLRSFMNPQG